MHLMSKWEIHKENSQAKSKSARVHREEYGVDLDTYEQSKQRNIKILWFCAKKWVSKHFRVLPWIYLHSCL